MPKGVSSNTLPLVVTTAFIPFVGLLDSGRLRKGEEHTASYICVHPFELFVTLSCCFRSYATNASTLLTSLLNSMFNWF